MNRPVFTAIVIVDEMPERWRGDYPVLTTQEFYSDIDAETWCQNFIKQPVAGGPKGPYKVHYKILFGVEIGSGEYGRGVIAVETSQGEK